MSQEWSLTPSAPIPVKPKGKGAIITGIVLLVVGILLIIGGIVAVAGAATNLVKEFGDSTYDTPNSFARDLTAGTTYVVYEQATGTTSRPGPTSVTPADVTVTGPSGSVVVVNDPGLNQTFETNGYVYIGVATFDADTSGSYTIEVGPRERLSP